MSNRRYVAIIWNFGREPEVIGIINRKFLTLELDKKINYNGEYKTMWLDMCPIDINRTFNIQVKENQLISRTF